MSAVLHPQKNPKDRNPAAPPTDGATGAQPRDAAARADDAPPELASAAEADALRQQLQAKEQLVHALTERLEQAAEQLDRLRRTGADKGRRPLGGGMPPELVEQHRSTIDDLKRVIERWEDMQTGATLGRIETQITELRDLVTGAVQTRAVVAGIAPQGSSASPPPAKPASTSWWEAQKASMLGEGPAPPPPGSQPDHEQADESQQPVSIGDTALPELPAPLDFESMTLEDARQAIRARDALIQRLREPLLLMQTSGQLPEGLQTLEQAPEPLRARLDELDRQWQAKFRQAELDLSLERARLAREQSTLRQQQEQVQKELKRLGLHGDKPIDPTHGRDDSSNKRRWFRFMAKAGESDARDESPKDND